MPEIFSNTIAALTEMDIARIRFASMFVVLIGGIISGYIANNKFGLAEELAKKIMTLVLIFLNWPIVLIVIWRMKLNIELVWLPVIGLILLLVMTAISVAIASLYKLEAKSRLTLILACALGNHGYTGGAFVCYALFGLTGLARAQIYVLFWIPVVYLIFLPLIRISEASSTTTKKRFFLSTLFDCRMLVVPAVIIAIILNLSNVAIPKFILRIHIADILIYTASSLAFFSIGLRITFSRLKNYLPLYFNLSAVKFIITPIVAFLIIKLLTQFGCRLDELSTNVIIVQSLAPPAVFMVTVSNVFGLDSKMGSALWVVATAIFAAVVVPILYFVFTRKELLDELRCSYGRRHRKKTLANQSSNSP